MKTSDLSILLAEDDANLGAVLASYLRRKGFEVNLCRDGAQALEAYKTGAHNFIITDIMMPIMDGFTFAKEVRSKDADIPIIFLTAKTLEEDVVTGFKIGADDYIIKPFNMEELLMRINAISRRFVKKLRLKEEDLHYKYSFRDIKFEYFKRNLCNGVDEISLQVREADLLKLFFEKENEAVERSYILNRLWGNDSYTNSRSLDVYTARLRSYLKPCTYIELLNLRGEGMTLKVDKSKDVKK
jgi:DNA-binding response OmpR family regulator